MLVLQAILVLKKIKIKFQWVAKEYEQHQPESSLDEFTRNLPHHVRICFMPSVRFGRFVEGLVGGWWHAG